MNQNRADGPIRLIVRDRADLERQLGQATESLTGRARELGDRGILVTRKSANEFIVELHPDVPFGLTREADRP